MNKSLYSLMLMDDVVAEIDKLALRENTTRSGLVNRILADYASMMTPEKRIGDICRYIGQLMEQSGALVPVMSQSRSSVSMKSSLEYKYRPTIRYEVQLSRDPSETIGTLNVIFRTQSESLLNALTDFFRLWKHLEDIYIAKTVGVISYELYDGRFTRSISVPQSRDYTNEDIGTAISRYVEMLDDLMKGYITHKYSTEQLENRYLEYLNSGVGLI